MKLEHLKQIDNLKDEVIDEANKLKKYKQEIE